MSTMLEPDKKNVNIEEIAKKASENTATLSELLDGILSKKDTVRFNSFKVLLLLSEKHPELLYAKWGFFANLLTSDNTHNKYIAIYIIANLTKIDAENKFEEIFDKYYNLLDDKSVIPAAHLASNSGKIAKAKPMLQAKITSKLLAIDNTQHKQGHKNLIKGYAIEAFNEYFEEAMDKKEIMEFVVEQTQNKSPTTRKKAEKFLGKWQKGK